MIQYGVCIIGCIIFYQLSKAAVEHNHDHLGFFFITISITFAIMIPMRLGYKDLPKIIQGVKDAVNWIIKG